MPSFFATPQFSRSPSATQECESSCVDFRKYGVDHSGRPPDQKRVFVAGEANLATVSARQISGIKQETDSAKIRCRPVTAPSRFNHQQFPTITQQRIARVCPASVVADGETRLHAFDLLDQHDDLDTVEGFGDRRVDFDLRPFSD
jgi:hypothetical protein